MQGQPDLLVRPHPNRSEGPRGYFLRLAEANCLTVTDLHQLGIQFDCASLSKQGLLPVRALDPDLHAHVDRLAGLLKTKSRIWNNQSRFCPECLREEPVWKADWEIVFHDVCPAHGCWMVDQCASCRQPLSWSRDAVWRCQCGSDLREEVARAAPQNPWRLSVFLEAVLSGREPGADITPIPFKGLDIDQAQRLIRYLGSYMDPQIGRKPLKRGMVGRMERSWPMTSLAAEILFQWPHAFHDCLNRLQESSAGQKKGLHGLFRYAYLYIYKGLREAAFAAVRQAFEEWISDHWRGGVARRNRRLSADLLANAQWVPGSIAADNLGISLGRLRHLVREGELDGQESVSTTGRHFLVVRRDQFDLLEARIANEVTMGAAMEMLGICKVRMQRVLRLLFPNARRAQNKDHFPWCIPRNEVEVLLAIGCDLPVFSIPEENQVALRYVFKHWNWTAEEIVALVEAVKGGTMQVQALLDGARGISRWIFQTGPLRAWHHSIADRSRLNWVSIPEMALILQVKQQVAYWLCQNGIVPAEKLGTLKGIGSRVRREHLDSFRENYVFSRDIAEMLGTSSRKVSRLLAEQGIYPVRGQSVDVCRMTFFRRSEEIQRFLVQLTGASPGAFKLECSLSSRDTTE